MFHQWRRTRHRAFLSLSAARAEGVPLGRVQALCDVLLSQFHDVYEGGGEQGVRLVASDTNAPRPSCVLIRLCFDHLLSEHVGEQFANRVQLQPLSRACRKGA